MIILGINDHHNSAAALLADGKLICAMQEERFTRKKNFWGMPKESIRAVLNFAGLTWKEIDHVAFAGRRHSGHVAFLRDQHMELLKQVVQMDFVDTLRGRTDVPLPKVLRRILHAQAIKIFPGFFRARELKQMKEERLSLFRQYFPEAEGVPIRFLDHHRTHFATALFGAGPSDQERLVFTNDGQGDLRCGSVTHVRPDGKGAVLSSIRDTDSIAQIWAYITLLTGFVPLEHEYKLMGMAPYAFPSRSEAVARAFEELFQWNESHYLLSNNGSIHSFYIQHLIDELNRICRFQRFDDICGGLQKFTEKALTRWIRHWIERTGIPDICLSGGTFMNVKANLEIMKMGDVRSVFVFPSCGDETNAIGACYQTYFDETGRFPEPLKDFYLGKDWSQEEISRCVRTLDLSDLQVEEVPDIENRIAELLAANEVVARFKGREEFGARALGNRSILANPSRWSVVAEINDMIKQRDFWMPFACSILAEDQHRYIKATGKNCGQYMIMCFEGGTEIDPIVAGIHPKDKTIRPHVVHAEKSPDYHRLITKFRELTGIGAILNTSFNLHGYPLVHSPEDAIEVFEKSGLKFLALGNYLLKKRS